MMTGERRRVVIVQRYVTHYRVPFYEQLRDVLGRRGVELQLVHGFPPSDGDGTKQDAGAVAWADTIQVRRFRVGPAELLWEPALPHVRGGDLVIVEQASSRLLNYVLFARQLLGLTRMAFWGHGKNFKASRASSLGEWVKRHMTRRVHWWFAYNELSARVVRATGFPAERITDVQNAVDTRSLVAARAALDDADLAALRAELDLPDRHIAVFVGGMYPEKRLGFLVEAAVHVRDRLPDFTLLLIGSGPDAGIAHEAAGRLPWVRYLGPRLGDDKVAYLAVSELLLMPGLVGLAILDAFALGLPVVTTDDAPHSPEIAYLEPGRNGVLLPRGTTPDEYGDEVVRLLRDGPTRARIAAAGTVARERYTIEEMVRRFADGIVAALDADERAPLRRLTRRRPAPRTGPSRG